MGGPNTLYYGDHLDILQAYIEDESVDLIYLEVCNGKFRLRNQARIVPKVGMRN